MRVLPQPFPFSLRSGMITLIQHLTLVRSVDTGFDVVLDLTAVQ